MYGVVIGCAWTASSVLSVILDVCVLNKLNLGSPQRYLVLSVVGFIAASSYLAYKMAFLVRRENWNRVHLREAFIDDCDVAWVHDSFNTDELDLEQSYDDKDVIETN